LLEFWTFKVSTQPAKDDAISTIGGTTGFSPFLAIPIRFPHIAVDFLSKQKGQQESSLKIDFCLSYGCSKLLDFANDNVQ
jgi:hypothetical protein